jgi:hypothetical protein
MAGWSQQVHVRRTASDENVADVRLAESANVFAQHHDGWNDVARAYAQLSEPLFIAVASCRLSPGRASAPSADVRERPCRQRVGPRGHSRGPDRRNRRATTAVRGPRPVHPFLAHAADPGFPSETARRPRERGQTSQRWRYWILWPMIAPPNAE